jgi:hypothetical protein
MAVLAVLAGLVALVPTLARSVRSVPRPEDWERPEDTRVEPDLESALA